METGKFLFPPPTLQEQMDTAMQMLQRNKDAWAAQNAGERLAILNQVQSHLLGVAERWVTASMSAKGSLRTPFERLKNGCFWLLFFGHSYVVTIFL